MLEHACECFQVCGGTDVVFPFVLFVLGVFIQLKRSFCLLLLIYALFNP